LHGCSSFNTPSRVYENVEWLPSQGDIDHVVQVPVIFQVRNVVPFGSKKGSKFTTHPYMKGRGAIDCLKREPNRDEEGEGHVEGTVEE
jgi:hypothetical protein